MTQVGFYGRLRITRTDGDAILCDEDVTRYGQVVFDEENLIVNYGLSAISRMIGGCAGSATVGGQGVTDPHDLAVTSMVLGNDPSPTTPANADTTGVSMPTFSPNLFVTYPSAYRVKFSGMLPKTESVGETITEEALYLKMQISGSPVVFAKKVFSQLKTSAYALQFDHLITVARIA